VAQEIECLPSKHKTLSSNPSTTKNKGARTQRPSLESHPFNGHSAGVHTNTHDIYFFHPGASVTRTLLHILGGQTTVAFCQYVLLDTNTHTQIVQCPYAPFYCPMWVRDTFHFKGRGLHMGMHFTVIPGSRPPWGLASGLHDFTFTTYQNINLL
jgi:hypothetical protein